MERHPWNTEFTWPRHEGPFRRVTAEQARAFDELGFFVLDDAFDADTVARVTAELEPGVRDVEALLAHAPGGRFSVAGLDTQTVAPHQVVRSPYLRAFATGPLFADLCHDLVGPDARLYWDQPVFKHPRSAAPVLWHQDNGYTFVEPQAYLTCWCALTDATTENGCIRVVPGVHRHGTLVHRHTDLGEECDVDEAEAVDVPVAAGGIVVFTSLTPHATGVNRTDATRKAYILQYAPDGAVGYPGDGRGARGVPVPQDDPDRQPLLLRGGIPVAA